MTLRSFHEEVTLAGGVISADELLPTVPPEYLVGAQQTTDQMGGHFEAINRRFNIEGGGAIAITRSEDFSCTVTQVREGAALLVPIGMVARLLVMARLLLQFYRLPQDKVPRYVKTPNACADHDAESIPPLLKPIFLETLSPVEFWSGLAELDQQIGSQPEIEWDVRELVHLALVFVLAHEFAHVLHGHFELLDKSSVHKLPIRDDRLRRGIEADADDVAAPLSLLVVDEDIRNAKARGQDV